MQKMGDDDDRADAESVPESKTCANCSTAIVTTDWYPVATDRDDDGTLRVYEFCTWECRDAWLDD